jgi:hypothetical protein
MPAQKANKTAGRGPSQSYIAQKQDHPSPKPPNWAGEWGGFLGFLSLTIVFHLDIIKVTSLFIALKGKTIFLREEPPNGKRASLQFLRRSVHAAAGGITARRR